MGRFNRENQLTKQITVGFVGWDFLSCWTGFDHYTEAHREGTESHREKWEGSTEKIN
jgi:hypothetical protein